MMTSERIRKILALLDSDQAGEVQAAAHALRRLLGSGTATATPRADHHELEASLSYAAAAIAELAGEIQMLRRDNAALRRGAPPRRTPGLRVAA
jgi:hypothetical protein